MARPNSCFSNQEKLHAHEAEDGLSRMVGEGNYGSCGASVNIEMEFEGALASEPGKLQSQIRQLFGLVRASLERGTERPQGRRQRNGQ